MIVKRDPFDIFGSPAPEENRQRYEISPGEGNLQMQAYMAAVIGPQRIAMGAKRTLNLEADEPLLASNCSPASRHCSFVALYLPVSSAGPATVTVGKEDLQGDSAGIPVQLVPLVAPATGLSFTQVLLPGERLYIQSTLDLTVIISEVSF